MSPITRIKPGGKFVSLALAGLLAVLACANFDSQGGPLGFVLLQDGGSGGGSAAAAEYSIYVQVTGLTGASTDLVLQNNGADDLALRTDGSHAFATAQAADTGYNVTVLTQPTGPTKLCTVSGGSGTVLNGDVTSITINCTAGYTVGGVVSGLAGSGLVLQNNGGDDLSITSNGAVAFGTPLTNGAAYSVSVLTQPTSPSQTCTLSGAAGTIAGADITNANVNCTTNSYTIGVNVSGLAGTGLVLQNNGGDNLNIAANGAATFATAVASGNTYNVTVLTQPSSPTQTCTVSGGSGTVASGNVTSITVNCSTSNFTVGGTVSGLAGTGLVLQNNGGDDLAVTANGAFAFSTAVASGAAYSVTVLTQPSSPTQTCVVSSGAGTVGAANVTSVTVTCTTGYTVGGTLTGLNGTGLVLQNNAGDDLTLNASGGFTFATALANGAAYAVTVLTQPTGPAQTCSLGNAAGTIAAANVTNVTVTCVDGNFTGGTIQTPPTFNSPAQLTTLAGDGANASTDGTGTGASFSGPASITTDGTNLYVIDRSSDTLRKIVIATGVTTTINTTPANPFSQPYGITTDGANLYVTDLTTDRIYQVVIATGVTTTLAGGALGGGTTCSGTNNGNCQDGTGTQAEFNLPTDITSDANNLYVADGFNDRIRKIVIATGVVTTLAGTGSTADFDFPKGMTTDGTYVYVVDTNNNRIRRVTIADGTTTTILTGVANIRGITTDGANLYLSSDNHQIFMYDSLTGGGTNSAIAGANGVANFANGDALTVGRLNSPNGITNDGDALYISDSSNNRIRKYK